MSSQNASVAHSIDVQTSIIKSFNFADVSVEIDDLQSSNKTRTNWFVLINKDCSLRELMSVFAARLSMSTDIKLNEGEFDTLILSVSEDLKLSVNPRNVVLAIFDDIDSQDKERFAKKFPEDTEDFAAFFDMKRRNLLALPEIFNNKYKATEAEYGDDILFQNLIKMSAGVNLKSVIKLQLKVTKVALWEKIKDSMLIIL